MDWSNKAQVRVLAAVTGNDWPFRFTSPELRADKDVVLTAVTQDGWTLEYASPELQADKDVVLIAELRMAWPFGSPHLSSARTR